MNVARAARPARIADWLAYLEGLHPSTIAMGLDRVRAVLARMQLRIDCPVITVAGTNGKGSTCAMMESILRCAGFRVGLYASPHLLSYNERVTIDGNIVDDVALAAAFNAVEDARTAVAPATPLTYFEFGTLAAFDLFARAAPDALVLEVGLGGRLDAVNVLDADVAVLTTVDIDHQEYLGATREAIGGEKAGVFRAGRPAICGEPDPPQSVIDHARAVGARLVRIGIDYDAVAEGAQWRYWGPGGARFGLSYPALRGACQLRNAATAIAALAQLRDKLPVSAGAIRQGLLTVALPGRFAVLPGRPTIVLDVAHNPHAARTLAACLGSMGFHPETIAVFGMLADKDIDGVVDAVKSQIGRWHVASLPGPRGAHARQLQQHLERRGIEASAIACFPDIANAYRAAGARAAEADRIVVFGSFLSVAAALAAGRPPSGSQLS